MFLPNRQEAYIPSAKLYEYLLSPLHAVGKSKAKFFSQFGFTSTNGNLLESGLLTIAHAESIHEIVTTPYGVKYIVDGYLPTPIGITVHVRTVWMVELGEETPRFITTHPLSKTLR